MILDFLCVTIVRTDNFDELADYLEYNKREVQKLSTNLKTHMK